MTAGILDKIIASQQADIAGQTDPHMLLERLVSRLRDRERNVLGGRFGFRSEDREPKTLKQIGDVLGVTRERVRQIELSAIKKLRDLQAHAEFKAESEALKLLLRRVLEEHGGIMDREHFLTRGLHMLLPDDGQSQEYERQKIAFAFLVDHLLDEVIERHPGDALTRPGWRLPATDHALAHKTISTAKEILEQKGEPMEFEELVNAVTHVVDCEVLHCSAHLHLSCELKPNSFGQWGLASWTSVTPRKINDKIYLVLKREGQPMHFTAIATKINDAKFDDKFAHPSTVHNELIFDKRYVLVGRGTYALSDWGYTPGVVSDVVARVIEDAGAPTTRQDIVDRVLKERMVRKSTVLLALTDRSRFTKLSDGRYTLAAATTPKGTE